MTEIPVGSIDPAKNIVKAEARCYSYQFSFGFVALRDPYERSTRVDPGRKSVFDGGLRHGVVRLGLLRGPELHPLFPRHRWTRSSLVGLRPDGMVGAADG